VLSPLKNNNRLFFGVAKDNVPRAYHELGAANTPRIFKFLETVVNAG